VRLAAKLTVFFLLISLCPVLAVGYFSYVNGQSTIEAQTIDQLRSINHLKREELNHWLKEKPRLLEIFAQGYFFTEIFPSILASHDDADLSQLKEERDIVQRRLKPFALEGSFFEIFILDQRNGEVLLSTDERQAGKHKNHQPYFRQGRNGTFIQKPYYSDSLQRPVITAATPIRDRYGDAVAVLAGRLDLESLSRIIGMRTSRSASEDTYLVNGSEFFITEPRFGDGYALKKTVNTAGVRAALEKRAGQGFYDDYRGVPVIGVYQWLSDWNLGIITEIDQEEAFRPIYGLRSTIFLVGLGTALLAGLAGLAMGRTIVHPIRRLMESTEMLGRGNLQTPVPSMGKAEIGELSKSFEQMRIRLNESLVSRDALMLEVAEHEKTMAALTAEKEFSERIINSMPGIFYLFDASLRFHEWNDNLETVTGYSHEEISSISPIELFPQGERKRISRGIEQVFEKGSLEAETTILTKTGREIPYYLTGYRVTVAGKHFLVGTGIDIADRKRAEQSVLRDRERLLALLDGINDLIYVADPVTYELLHLNAAAQATSGEDAIGKPCYEALQGRAEPCPFCTNDKILGEHRGQSYVWEFRNETNRRWYQCADKAIQWVDGRVVRFEIATDITPIKAVQQELTSRTQDLERSNRELEQFAYVASHDLQEPLRMVASYTQLLARRYEGQLDAKADRYIGYAVEGAKRMQVLVNDLLTLSRVGTRGKPFEETDCEVLINHVLRNMERIVEETGAVVTVGPMPKIKGDAGQLTQVFQNLLENAIKFRGETPPNVDISSWETEEAWVFEVSDNGIGIDPRYHERIFLVFQRLHERERYPGSGIGLSIAKKIVERHGGEIRVESAENAGSRFIFTILKHQAEGSNDDAGEVP